MLTTRLRRLLAWGFMLEGIAVFLVYALGIIWIAAVTYVVSGKIRRVWRYRKPAVSDERYYSEEAMERRRVQQIFDDAQERTKTFFTKVPSVLVFLLTFGFFWFIQPEQWGALRLFICIPIGILVAIAWRTDVK